MNSPMSIEELRHIQEKKGTQQLVTYILFSYCHDGMFTRMNNEDLYKFLKLLENESNGVKEVFNLVVILEKEYRTNTRKVVNINEM